MEGNENINKDPDVNINSWIFVEKVDQSNQTNLDSEYSFKNMNRVEELTEDDLGSNDSDGISVISETEDHSPDCCTCLPKIDLENEDNETTLNNESAIVRKEYKENKQSDDTEEDENKMELDTPNNICISNNFQRALENLSENSIIFNTLFLSAAIATICILFTYVLSNCNTPDYLMNDVLDFNDDRPDTEIIIDDIFDEITEIHDDLWIEPTINNDTTTDFDLLDLKPEFHTINNLVQPYVENVPVSVILTPNNMQKNNINLPTKSENKKIINQNANKDKITEHYVNTQNKYISTRKTKKQKVTMNKNSENQNKNIDANALKMKENYLKKKDKYLMKKEKHLKKLEKQIIQMEVKLKKIHYEMINDYPTDSKGEWYQKMTVGRSEIRKKERISEWVFDRAKARSNFRDKAYWYFNRGNAREEIRSNKGRSEKRKNKYDR